MSKLKKILRRQWGSNRGLNGHRATSLSTRPHWFIKKSLEFEKYEHWKKKLRGIWDENSIFSSSAHYM